MAKVAIKHKGDLLLEAQVGNHTLGIDVPASVGGKDRGMTPTELFGVSLGACIAAMVALYCKNSQIDATGLAVDVSYDKLDNPSRLGNFKATVRLPAELDEVRRKALLRVADRCPVHETIKEGIGLEIALAS